MVVRRATLLPRSFFLCHAPFPPCAAWLFLCQLRRPLSGELNPSVSQCLSLYLPLSLLSLSACLQKLKSYRLLCLTVLGLWPRPSVCLVFLSQFQVFCLSRFCCIFCLRWLIQQLVLNFVQSLKFNYNIRSTRGAEEAEAETEAAAQTPKLKTKTKTKAH